MGRFGTSGSIIFRRAWDTSDKGDNDRESFVTILSGAGPINQIVGLTIDQTNPMSFNDSGQAIGGYSGWMWQRSQLGSIPTDTALDFGVGAGTPPGWGADRRLHGLAATAWTLRYDTTGDKYQSGVPSPKWTAEGILCYDPRQDSTYPGGSGSHRWADPSDKAAFDAARATWTYSTNPYLHGLRWALGTWERDPGDPDSVYVKAFGIGVPAAGVDVAAFVEGANIADTNGWSIAGVIYSADAKWDSLKKILQAGMGEPIMLGAKLSCFTNAPKVSLATINAGDVVGKASVAGTQSRRSRINRITPRYYQAENNWQLLPGTPVAVPEYYAIDAGQRSSQVDYTFIPDLDGGKQIATACRYDIENAREFGPITLPLKLRWIGYKPGDCVTVNYPEIGLSGQPILLTNRSFDPAACAPTFTARSETNAKHAFALGQTTTPPPTPGVSGPPLIPVPGSTAWTLTAVGLVAGDTRVPALTIAGAVDSPVAEQIVFEYREFVSGQADDAGWAGAQTLPPTATQAVIASVRPGANYEAAVSYRRYGQTGQRLLLGPVGSGDLNLDFDYVTGPKKPDDNATVGAPAGTLVAGVPAELVAEKISSLDDIFGIGPGTVSAIALAQAALEDNAAEQALANLLLDDQAVRGANAALASARQELTQKINADGTAEANARLALAVQLGSLGAAVVEEQDARSSADLAEASAREALEARLNNAGGTGVTAEAAIASNKSAIVDLQANKASTDDLTAAESTLNGNIAAAVSEVKTESDAKYATASDLTTIEAQVNGSGGLSAQVTHLDEVTADTAGKVKARFEEVASVGGVSAGVRAIVENDDGTTTSDLALVAQAIGLWLQASDGSLTRALGLDIEGGVPVARLYAALLANSITADKFVTGQGVDLIAMLTGTLGARFATTIGSAGSPLVTNSGTGSTASSVHALATLNLNASLQHIEGAASITGFLQAQDGTHPFTMACNLLFSADGGTTWGNSVPLVSGNTGAINTSPQTFTNSDVEGSVPVTGLYTVGVQVVGSTWNGTIQSISLDIKIVSYP